MSRRDAILGTHRGAIVDAAHRHNATFIALVGSTARGGDTATSDFDFLADFAPGTTYFELSDLVAELQSLLGCDVDVIPAEGLKPRKHARILADALPLLFVGHRPLGVPQSRETNRNTLKRGSQRLSPLT